MNNTKFSILIANKKKKESVNLIDSLIEGVVEVKGISEMFLHPKEKPSIKLKGKKS